ncbi:MAG: C_GCAxxG_C_C family protein [Anaerolineae bacterium]|nr:C_GCAxxG_C_C family protein [Anaerolineae bacterium]
MPPLCVRMATALAGGIGCSHEEACGALSGGAMVIGALHGRTDSAQNDDLAQSLTVAYRDRFQAEFGTTCCGPLRDWVQGPGGPGTCAAVVERAARILLDVLA